MATLVQTSRPVPAATFKVSNVMSIKEIVFNQSPRLMVLFDREDELILQDIKDVLGHPCEKLATQKDISGSERHRVVALESTMVHEKHQLRNTGRTVIVVHALDIKDCRNDDLTSYCDYEYLYTRSPFWKRDLARFLGFVLGQVKPHDALKVKERTTLISTTFPDIRAALPNLDVISVGADSIELRVDLLEETLEDGSIDPVPSLKYVGEQLMLLRQRTELPVVFTTRCTAENGRFPMQDPLLFYKYLRKAMQWGCEYIDIELWLPDAMRRRLVSEKGNSTIISAFHDFSSRFEWRSNRAKQLFEKSAAFGDVVKMIALVKSTEENFELESFRSATQRNYPNALFSGINMGPEGQLSRALNKVFTPVTHPLLPLIAAPGQLSAAEINAKLHTMGQLPALDLYAVGNMQANGQAMFLEKCLNELSLPHRLRTIMQTQFDSIAAIVSQINFGGAFIYPPLATSTVSCLPRLSAAASAIGQIDVVAGLASTRGSTLVGDNASWAGIRATLTTDFVPSAYADRVALILASAESQAAPTIYALKSLGIGSIYTIGFKMRGPLASEVEALQGVEDIKKVDNPFVIVSALSADKALSVTPLIKHYSNPVARQTSRTRGVYLDLGNGTRKVDPLEIANSAGWTTYNNADVNAWTMVETIRLLLGQNVPYEFVRLASGRSLYG